MRARELGVEQISEGRICAEPGAVARELGGRAGGCLGTQLLVSKRAGGLIAWKAVVFTVAVSFYHTEFAHIAKAACLFVDD